ncbi:MAG: hypothetical protein VKJ24_07245 [Synechococcales bacterium]|nr:hypothetical protein [Synechococcales bacterium]
MAGKRRSPTSTLVSKSAIQQASSILQDLPEKPKEIWSLREAIDALKDQITLALDRGYGYNEISKMLSEKGVEISASTLKYYLSSVKRNSEGGKVRRRRRNLGAKVTEKTLAEATAAVNAVAGTEEAAPKRRGGRRKAAPAPEPEVVPAAPKRRGRIPKAAKVEEAPAPKARATKAPRVAKAKIAPVPPAKRGRRKSVG